MSLVEYANTVCNKKVFSKECAFDAELGVVVHVFHPARRTCSCGEQEIPEPPRMFGNSFFRKSADDPKEEDEEAALGGSV